MPLLRFFFNYFCRQFLRTLFFQRQPGFVPAVSGHAAKTASSVEYASSPKPLNTKKEEEQNPR